jgi:oxygen-dependent protoporphyrinogen oxidase
LVTIVPTRIGPFLRSGLISWPGILRMAMDLVLPGKPPDGDEPLAGFFRRRLGREVFERLIEPLMAGIYAGDADRMSLLATFPRFIELERQYGSLIRGMLKAGRKARTRLDESIRRTTFVTLRDGLSALTARLLTALAEAGTTLRLGRPVTELRVRPTRSKSCRYDLRLSDEVLAADAVVLATPAFASADLVRPFNPGAAQLLDAIPYASTATVSLAYAAADLGPSVKGFGFVVPRSEHRDLLAATWTSLKWKDRAPSFQTLIRGYIGGAGKDSLIKADDETLAGSVRRELKELAAIDSAPSHVTVHRWERGMPQYTMGHLNRLDEIETWLRPYRGLYLAGAAYRGVGIPDCIRDGTDTAERVIRDLRESR